MINERTKNGCVAHHGCIHCRLRGARTDEAVGEDVDAIRQRLRPWQVTTPRRRVSLGSRLTAKSRRTATSVTATAAKCARCSTASLDACLEQIRAGYAWWSREYANEQSAGDCERYELAEQEARASKIGLWREPNLVPPWEWRHS